ncbi:MAG: alanine racemase [Myxococcales bacterium]|nr:alanine racemase [Myxococcales bacterium]
MLPRPTTDVRPTRVEVDLAAIKHNVAQLHAEVATPIWAVIKADGYGHGAVQVASVLDGHPAVCGFAVSLVEEGVALRDAGVVAPVLVLGPAQHGGEVAMVRHGLTPAISDVAQLHPLAAAAAAAGRNASVHLKIDTGMGRLGIMPADAAAALAQVASMAGISWTGLLTHFANADTDQPSDHQSTTFAQLAAFEASVVMARTLRPGIMIHAANSAGAISFPSSRFDAVRLGLALYGNGPWATSGRVQVMRLVTQVAQLRQVPAGHAVGYGQTWRAGRDTRVAVLPLGYADGYPRSLSGKAFALLRGKRVAIVGRVSMDMVMADVTDVAGAAVGDDVTMLGRDGTGAEISTAEFAAWSQLSEYEVTCGMSKRVPRVYVGL